MTLSMKLFCTLAVYWLWIQAPDLNLLKQEQRVFCRQIVVYRCSFGVQNQNLLSTIKFCFYTKPYYNVSLVQKDLIFFYNLNTLKTENFAMLPILQLKRNGFVEMDALDASEGMLNEARKKKIYRNCFQEFFSEDSLIHQNGNAITF